MKCTIASLVFMTGLILVHGASIAEFDSSLMRRRYITSTSNQLMDGTECRAVTVIYARGTLEEGNVGSATEVGLLTFNALAQIIGEQNLALQGIDYPANVAGFETGGDPTGSQLMASLTAQVRS